MHFAGYAYPFLSVHTIQFLLQALFVPLVHRLGYDYADTDSTDISLLRTCAITQAAEARDSR